MIDRSTKPSLYHFLRSYPLRIALYAAATLVTYELTYLAIRSRGADYMSQENGPIELTQVALALIATACLFYAAWITTRGRAALVLCGSLVAYAAARESDLWFETYLFDDAYKWVVGAPLALLSVSMLYVERKNVVNDVMQLMSHPAATLFAIAGVFLCFVCQMFDRPDLWIDLAATADTGATKALIEESTELFAYLLLAFSGIEAGVVRPRRRDRECPNRGGRRVRVRGANRRLNGLPEGVGCKCPAFAVIKSLP